MLRAFLIGGAVILALVVGLWVLVARGTEAALASWFSEREADGWVVHYENLSTTGFPTDIVTRVEGLDIADPQTGWAWGGPEWVLEHSLLDAGAVLVTWPNAQFIATPQTRIDISADEMTSALDLRASENLAVDLARWDMEQVVLAAPTGWQAAIATAHMAMTRLDAAPALYDVTFQATGVTPPDAWRMILDPAGVLPAAMSQSQIIAQVQFDRPWDLDALEQSRPQITHLRLDEASSGWGDVTFRAAGEVAVDGAGIPQGDLTIRVENWRQMLDLAQRAGVISADMARMLDGTLGFLADLSGARDHLEAALRFEGGLTFFGPIPLGPAPRLILR